MTDERSHVYVHANYNADDVRTFYEIPETVVERVRAVAPPEQAWEAIRRGDLLTDPEPAWAHVVVKDGRFVELVDAEGDNR